jgi:hypothetical protein
MYLYIFWLGCLGHTLDLLMHDIIKIKDHDYQWIGALYMKGKRMIKFVTNHSHARYIYRNNSNLELLRLQRLDLLAITSPSTSF